MVQDQKENLGNIDWVYNKILELLNLKESDLSPYQKQEILDNLHWLVWAVKNNPK